MTPSPPPTAAGAAAPARAQGEAQPTESLWQYRSRPEWSSAWNAWTECSAAVAADYQKTPVIHDWVYETRRFYLAAPLQQIRDHLNVMLASAIPNFDGGNDGDVMGYHIRTGALHKIIGLLSGIGLPVNVPNPYQWRSGKCCGHSGRCRDVRCPLSMKEEP